MPMINRECDYCKVKKPRVEERYQVQSGMTIKMKRHELTGELIPANLTYWCPECAKKISEELK